MFSQMHTELMIKNPIKVILKQSILSFFFMMNVDHKMSSDNRTFYVVFLQTKHETEIWNIQLFHGNNYEYKPTD